MDAEVAVHGTSHVNPFNTESRVALQFIDC